MVLLFIFNILINKKMEDLSVINSRQENQNFSAEKIYESCIRSGASEKIAHEVAEEIKNQAFPEITTIEIAKLVKSLLVEKSKKAAIKFSLKEAMRKLGPSGFNFEKYIASIFSKNNFEIKINQMIPGFCVPFYEIDFLAKKDEFEYIGECKYHTYPGKRVDLKIALYNNARFLDICKKLAFEETKRKAILVTNTKFTERAIQYSECSGVDLLGWKYPINNGLEKLIEESSLYPITILPSFKGTFKDIFAKEQMMLVKDLLERSPKQVSGNTGVSIKEINQLIEEANILLN